MRSATYRRAAGYSLAVVALGVTLGGRTAKPSEVDALASIKPHHVALAVPNFEATVAWYRDKLGFRVLDVRTYPPLRARGVFLERNGFLIEIFARDGSTRAAPVPAAVPDDLLNEGYKHIGFAVDDVDAAVAELGRRGVEIAAEPQDVGELGLRLAFVRDNNGNLIELGSPLSAGQAR